MPTGHSALARGTDVAKLCTNRLRTHDFPTGTPRAYARLRHYSGQMLERELHR
jgi:hypothetical protein